MYPMTLNNIHVVGCTCWVSGYVKELQLSVTQDKKISIFILGVTWCCDALQEIDNQRAGEMLAKLYASANVLFAVQRLTGLFIICALVLRLMLRLVLRRQGGC